jgi:hypothetical protein
MSTDPLHGRLMELTNTESTLDRHQRCQLASRSNLSQKWILFRYYANMLLDSMGFIIRNQASAKIDSKYLLSINIVLGKRDGNFEIRFYSQDSKW